MSRTSRVSILNELKREIRNVRQIMSTGVGRYSSAREVLNEATVEIRRNNLRRALELVKLAQQIIERENSLIDKIEFLREKIVLKSGFCQNELDRAETLISNGNLDEVESLLENISKFIEFENEIVKRIGEVENVIERRLPGSNPEEAEKFLNLARVSLDRGEYERAREYVDAALNSAKPTPDFLLQKAKNLSAQAEERFASREFEDSIELWKRSIEEYRRAKESALERGDEMLSKEIERVISVLEENIEKAEIAMDNRDMLELIKKAGEITETGNEVFDAGNYIDAENKYRDAIELYRKALEIAEKREFPEKSKILDAIGSLESSVEACLIGRGESYIRDAEQSEDASEAEKRFRETLDYLESIEVRDENAVFNSSKKGFRRSHWFDGQAS